MKKILLTFPVCLIIFLSSEIQAGIGFRTSEDNVFTLYRSSALKGGETLRIHVATFDTRDGEKYNQESCEIAKSLFQEPLSVIGVKNAILKNIYANPLGSHRTLLPVKTRHPPDTKKAGSYLALLNIITLKQ